MARETSIQPDIRRDRRADALSGPGSAVPITTLLSALSPIPRVPSQIRFSNNDLKGRRPMPTPLHLSQPMTLALLAAGLAAAPAPPNQTAGRSLDADIAPYHGLTIGGTFAAWGTEVHIQPARAFATERGKCAFRIGYDMVNTGHDTTSAFTNTLTAGVAVVDTKNGLHLSAGQSILLGAQAWLAPGTVDLIVHLDAGNAVPETNEQNNTARVRVTLDGKCLGAQQGLAPGAPGEEKARAPFLPPGSPNAVDQTNEEPAPQRAAQGPEDPGALRGAAEFGRPAPNGIIINDCQGAIVRRLGAAAAAIIAKCDGSVMTLKGQVPTLEAKTAAERAARSVPGVTMVNNLLVVSHRDGSS
jgi:hypothetical protein